MDDCKRGLEELKKKLEQDEFNVYMKKKSEKEMRNIIGDDYNRHYSHCGRCLCCSCGSC